MPIVPFRRIKIEIPRTAVVIFSAAVAVSSVLTAGDMSARVQIMTDPDSCFLWHTATNSEMRLEWDLPPSAGYADLVIEGAGYHETISRITENFVDVSLPPHSNGRNENVYHFTLNFSDGTSQSAVLGLVSGHTAVPNGQVPPVRCRLDVDAPSWKSASKRYVISVPQGAELSVNGEPVETHLDGGVGWYAVGPLNSGTWTGLSLEGESIASVDVLSRGPGHFVVIR